MRMDREPVLFTRKRRHWGRWLISLVLAAVALCALYTFYDNGRVVIRTQRVLVSNLPEELEGFTVLLLSDLNGKRFGPEQEHLINLLQNQRYDVVCVSGDMVGSGADPYPFYELLHSLSTQPVYFIAGDSDPVAVGGQPEGYHTVLADWIAGAQTRGAVYLDAPASLQVGEATVWFSDAAQIDLDLDSAAAAYAALRSRAQAMTELNAALKLAAPDGIVLPFAENYRWIRDLLDGAQGDPAFLARIRELGAEAEARRRALLARLSRPQAASDLTDRELVIARLAANRATNREIAAQLGATDTVTSPTFAIVNQYKGEGNRRIHHFDFYRINDLREAFDFGYEEYFYSGDLCLVEWPEKIEQLLPDNTMTVRITVDSDTARTFEID